MNVDEWHTEDIILEDRTEKEFDLLKPNWNAEKWNNGDAVLCEITQTIVDTNYEHLFLFLWSHDYMDELSVRKDRNKWSKVYRSQVIGEDGTTIDDDIIRDMARKVERCPINKNYLDIKLRKPDVGVNEKIPRAIIEFSEYKGLIIATRVIIPPSYANLFGIDSIGQHKSYQYYHGIVGVPDYGQLAAQSISLVKS